MCVCMCVRMCIYANNVNICRHMCVDIHLERTWFNIATRSPVVKRSIAISRGGLVVCVVSSECVCVVSSEGLW